MNNTTNQSYDVEVRKVCVHIWGSNFDIIKYTQRTDRERVALCVPY
jgi:hypothetical protein